MAIHYKFSITSVKDASLTNYQEIHCANFIDAKTTLCNIDITPNTETATSEKITCPDCLEIIKRCKEVKTSEISSKAQRVKVPYECFKLNWELQKGRTKVLDLSDYKAIVILSEGLELIHKKTSQKVKIWRQEEMENAIINEYKETCYLNFYYFNDDYIFDYAKEEKILIRPGEDWKTILKEGRKK